MQPTSSESAKRDQESQRKKLNQIGRRIAGVGLVAGLIFTGTACSFDGPELESSATGNYKDATYDKDTNTVTTDGKKIRCDGSAMDGAFGHDGRLRVDESGKAYIEPKPGDRIATLVGRYVSWPESTLTFQDVQTAEARRNNIDAIGTLPQNIPFYLDENCFTIAG
jgi:hypothetical protein